MNNLKKNKTTLIRNNIQCNLCNGNKGKSIYTYSYNDRNSEILKCYDCGHLYLYPIPLIELDERKMETVSSAEFYGNKLLKTIHEKVVIKREIRNAKKFLKSNNPTLLDIGCGTGWTTEIWRNNGFNVTGLEPSSARSNIASGTYNINIVNQYLENFQTDTKFDVIIMRHLLEHIEDPSAMLKKIQSFLKPEGLLIIIIPNIDSIGRYIFGENWEWILPWHLHFYTPRTLTMLVEKMGYKKMKCYQMPSPLWYPKSLGRLLKKEWRIPSFLNLVLFSPIILLGVILNLNDNITLISKNISK